MLSVFSQLVAQSASISTNGTGTADNQTMSIIAWLVLGLIAGFIASKIINKSGEGIVLDIILGIIGAFVGGFIVRAVGIGNGVSGLNIPSLLVAVLGAVVVLIVYHAMRGNLGKAR